MRKMMLSGSVCALVAALLIPPFASDAFPSVPDEPGEECLVEQSFDTMVGLLFRSYSLREDGYVDYRTARHILGISYDDPAHEELDVAADPMFYWYDAHRDGQWELWVDRDEEGASHAVRYDWKQGADLIANRM